MKRLDITAQELYEIIEKNEVVGRGWYGMVFKLNDSELFKFDYKNFKLSLNNLQFADVCEAIEIAKAANKTLKEVCHIENPNAGIEKLISLQDKIKFTKLTKGLVFVDDVCVGYLLNYHKDMISILDYCKKHTLGDEERKQIIENIKRNAKELFDNGIFPEISVANTLIDPKTNEIQLIDFEDEMTLLRENRPEMLYRSGESQIREIEKFLLDHKKTSERCL